jgi:hypothetical protein
MAYCPKCFAEYNEGTAQCMDCQVPLVAGPPPAVEKGEDKEPEPQLVRLRTFYGPTSQLDANLAKNVLEAEGIPCILPGEGEMIPGADVVQIWVREEDADRAAEILKSYLGLPQPAVPDDEPAPEN